MNKKTYCTPAINVAEGVLQPVLVGASKLGAIQQQSLGTANETTRTYLNLNGYKAWSSVENDDTDDDFDF